MNKKTTALALVMVAAVLLAPSKAQETRHAKQRSLSTSLESAVVALRVQLSPFESASGDIVTLEVAVQVLDGWHIYPLQKGDEVAAWLPTEIKFDAIGLVPIEPEFVCSELPVEKKVGIEVQPHLSGKFSWKRKFRLAKDKKKFGGKGTVSFQACNDEECLPPQTLEFVLGEELADIAFVDGKFEPIGEPFEVNFETCELDRPKAKRTLATLLFYSNPIDKLVLKGTLQFSKNKQFDIYLPRDRKYTVKNSSPNDGRIAGNSSTYVSIDQDGDGRITEHETYAATLPIRIENKMFKIIAMDKKAKRITIQQINTPMFGTIVGKPIPPFKYKTVDGRTITNESILGKVTILDIWAVT